MSYVFFFCAVDSWLVMLVGSRRITFFPGARDTGNPICTHNRKKRGYPIFGRPGKGISYSNLLFQTHHIHMTCCTYGVLYVAPCAYGFAASIYLAIPFAYAATSPMQPRVRSLVLLSSYESLVFDPLPWCTFVWCVGINPSMPNKPLEKGSGCSSVC